MIGHHAKYYGQCWDHCVLLVDNPYRLHCYKVKGHSVFFFPKMFVLNNIKNPWVWVNG